MGQTKTRWSHEEEEALKKGVERHGAGKWRAIQKDEEFKDLLTKRSNVDLKVRPARIIIIIARARRRRRRAPRGAHPPPDTLPPRARPPDRPTARDADGAQYRPHRTNGATSSRRSRPRRAGRIRRRRCVRGIARRVRARPPSPPPACAPTGIALTSPPPALISRFLPNS